MYFGKWRKKVLVFTNFVPLLSIVFRLEGLIDKHEKGPQGLTVDELIGPVKLAIQLLRNTATAEKETEEVVKLDSTVPDEG